MINSFKSAKSRNWDRPTSNNENQQVMSPNKGAVEEKLKLQGIENYYGWKENIEGKLLQDKLKKYVTSTQEEFEDEDFSDCYVGLEDIEDLQELYEIPDAASENEKVMLL